ncbi:hypothetical protein AB0C02_13665 [Micromonospora sp. NPDC048999]|uniref:hypothetical protein n=1 Tax=Micromonospora sp. NPDC048999 TaxID=3155391 RepID=UPI0033F4E886
MTVHEEEVRAALAVLVANEPGLPSGTADIERRGTRRRVRRRVAVGALAAVPLLAGAVAVAVWPAAPPRQVAQLPSSPPAVADPNAGSQLAIGFPVGSAVDAVSDALPAGVSLAELPMDVGWRTDGSLALPLSRGGELTLTVGNGTCVVSAPHLNVAQAEAAADAVCAAWRAAGSPPVVPAGPAGPEQPELATR